MNLTFERLYAALQLIAEGYEVDSAEDQFIIVQNDVFDPPNVVIDIKEVYELFFNKKWED